MFGPKQDVATFSTTFTLAMLIYPFIF
jgi:hypothetical protein